MLSGAYYGVISPEGAASILGRYTDDAHKVRGHGPQVWYGARLCVLMCRVWMARQARQFPLDCQELAKGQGIYASQLKDLGGWRS
jgi:hypothetical protein